MSAFLSSFHSSNVLNATAEYGMGGQISAKGDVYSYGVLLLEMFTGHRGGPRI